TRNAKLGLSPYRPIDVEELFDALRILFRRDQLLVSEFVERWDGTISDHFQKFDVRRIKAALSRVINSAIAKAVNRASASHLFDSAYEELAKALQPKSTFTSSGAPSY